MCSFENFSCFFMTNFFLFSDKVGYIDDRKKYREIKL